MQDEQLQTLNHNDLVLTVNRRLARTLRKRYDQLKLSSGLKAWQSPTIIPLKTWLESQADGFVISDYFAEIVWQRIMDSAFICDEKAAQQAFSAWQLLHEFEISYDDLHNDHREMVQAWLGWAQAFDEYLEENCYSAYPHLNIDLPTQDGKTYCIGFDRITPRTKKIINKLNAEQIELPKNNPHENLYVAQNTDQELKAMVHWAIANKDKKIACVVPELNKYYDQLESLFLDANVEANIIAPIPLSTYPIVASALLLLKLCSGECDFAELSSVMRSPFFDARFGKDYHLREHCAPTVLFSDMDNVPAPDNKQQTHHAWANYFLRLLEHYKWPGSRVLNSAEIQSKTRFAKCFEQFSSADYVDSEVTQSTALEQFFYLVQNTFFQPEVGDESIVVSGLLETAGQQFDAIWLMGMNDETLPEPLAPNPFLPFKIQSELMMPHANANSEIDYADHILRRLKNSTQDIIISFSKMDGDRELNVSPFFSHLKKEGIVAKDNLNVETTQLETLLDNKAPRVTDNEKTHGGTYILQAQAACPFKAFAEIRLAAHALPEPVSGLPAFERGNLVHLVLENIFQKIKNQSELQSFDDDQLSAVVDNIFASLPASSILMIEKKRLTRVIKKWLDYEKKRPPFSVIGVEEQQQITLAGLTINIRIDRIDRLADDTIAIIDYKTGKTHVSDWYGERPSQPQLPLYSLTSNEVSTISFANVRLQDISFTGISKSKNRMPDVKYADNWQELTAEWRDNLTQLIEQFLAGDARVDPKNGAATCLYCECQPFCRIQ